MGKSIKLPFLELPNIQISTEEAYKTLITGGIVRAGVYSFGKDGVEFLYVKEHPRRRGKFICSHNVLFKPYEVFCIARNEEIFLNRYYGADIFYLFE